MTNTQMVKEIEKRILRINKRKNSKFRFKSGKSFPLSYLLKQFSHIYPELSTVSMFKHPITGRRTMAVEDSVKVVQAYNGINSVLAEKGMAIKAKNYYTEFHLLGKGDKIQRIKNARKNGTFQYEIITAKNHQQAVTAKVESLKIKAKRTADHATRLSNGITRHKCVYKTPLTQSEIDRATVWVNPNIMKRSYGN